MDPGHGTAENTTIFTDTATIPKDQAAISTDAINATAETVTMASDNPLAETVLQIRFWYYPVVIPVGIIGNLLVLLVVLKKQNRSLSCSVYMGALAVADILTLLGQGGLWMINGVLPGILSIEQFNIPCKVSAYTVFSAAFGGVMIILALLVERVIAVTWPLKAAVLLSRKRAVIIVIIICVVTLAYNVPIIFTATMAEFFGQQCISVLSTRASVVYQVSKLLLNGVLPFVAILAMNLTILCAVKAARRKNLLAKSQTDVRNSGKKNNASDVPAEVKTSHEYKMRERERQLTLMTAVMSLCFLCLTMPKYAHQLAFINIDWQRSEIMIITLGYSAIMTQNLYVLNSAINFFLYCISGSKFRADLRKMFSCKTSSG